MFPWANSKAPPAAVIIIRLPIMKRKRKILQHIENRDVVICVSKAIWEMSIALFLSVKIESLHNTETNSETKIGKGRGRGRGRDRGWGGGWGRGRERDRQTDRHSQTDRQIWKLAVRLASSYKTKHTTQQLSTLCYLIFAPYLQCS